MSPRRVSCVFRFQIGRGLRCPVAADAVPSNKFTAQNGIDPKKHNVDFSKLEILRQRVELETDILLPYGAEIKKPGSLTSISPIHRNDGEFTYLRFLLLSAQDFLTRLIFVFCSRDIITAIEQAMNSFKM